MLLKTSTTPQPPETARADAPAGLPRVRRIVQCPACQGESLYAPENPFRPFCSARCKGLDLGAWASESFRVPTEAPPEEEPFGDPRLQ